MQAGTQNILVKSERMVIRKKPQHNITQFNNLARY
jgi:hypothetical protein